MKKLLIISFVLIALAGVGYYGYQHFVATVVANSITSESDHSWMPFQVNTKINRIKKPVNEMAAEVVKRAHDANLSMDDIIQAIDEAKEEQAYAFLDELNTTEIENTDAVFSMAKRHFPVDFDVEIFRESFNNRITVNHIQRGIKLANEYKDQEELDAETAKSILKKILLQKEEEFNKIIKNN